jgi:hypothetical protein
MAMTAAVASANRQGAGSDMGGCSSCCGYTRAVQQGTCVALQPFWLVEVHFRLLKAATAQLTRGTHVPMPLRSQPAAVWAALPGGVPEAC